MIHSPEECQTDGWTDRRPDKHCFYRTFCKTGVQLQFPLSLLLYLIILKAKTTNLNRVVLTTCHFSPMSHFSTP